MAFEDMRILRLIRENFHTKLATDFRWNLIAFAVLGTSGILLNVIVGGVYGAEALGIFNQALSFYIVFSQFSVFGIFLSTLKFTVEYEGAPSHRDRMITAAIVSTGIIAFFVSVLSYLFSPVFGRMVDSHAVGKAVGYISVGLWFFSLNKILLAFLNGMRKMKAYANFQALRYILIILFIWLIYILGWDRTKLTLSITGTEIVLFTALAFYTKKFYRVSLAGFKKWTGKHLAFCTKAFLSGAMIEINTRVDIIMLGYFCQDAMVGLYSLPALIVEGLMQLTVILKDNINPVLTKYYIEKKFNELILFIKKVKTVFYLIMFFLCTLALPAYWLFLKTVFAGRDFGASLPIFLILNVSLFVASGYLSLNMILNQAGFPGHYTLFILANLSSNIILNLLLIPRFGVLGAAFATGASWIGSIPVLKVYVKKVLSLKI